MTNLLHILILLTVSGLMSFKKADDKISIFYDSEVGVVESCPGQIATGVIEISTNSKTQIKVYNLRINQIDYELFYNGKKLDTLNSLILTENKSIKLLFKFKIASKEPFSTKLFFHTTDSNYLNNTIVFTLGQIAISIDDIHDSRNQTLAISEGCLDSIRVYFPIGGTLSHVNLYKDSKKEIFKSVSYFAMEIDTYITLSKNDTGRYLVDFSSCHWGEKFWLTVK
jgi:hypothetical protein